MKYCFDAHGLDRLQPTEKNDPLIVDAAVLNHLQTDRILVGANWKVFLPLMTLEVSQNEVRLSRRDDKPLDIVQVVDDDRFSKPTLHLPAFHTPPTSIIMRKNVKQEDEWFLHQVESQQDVHTDTYETIKDPEVFEKFAQWLTYVALETQQPAAAA